MAFDLDMSKTALVLIDLEPAIVGRKLAPYSGEEVVAKCRTLADAVRTAGGLVVFVHVLVNETLALPADKPTPKPEQALPERMTDIVPEMGRQAGDVLITKRQWGAFYATALEQTLDRRGIETVILAGIATNFGVESTARAAFDRGYGLVFAEDAMSTMSKEWQEFSVTQIFPVMGRVGTVAEIVAGLR